MRFSAIQSKTTLAVLLLLCLAITGLLKTPRQQAVAEQPDDSHASAAASDAANQPVSHVDLYRRLQKPVTVDFRNITLADALDQLSADSGVDIEFFDDIRVTPRDSQRRFTIVADKSVSVLRAIQQTIPHSYSLLLTERGVRIVSKNTVGERLVLETHNLSDASNYTTHLRTRWIEQVRREMAAARWGEVEGAWIMPSRSVFAVDVYHRLPAQQKIAELWRSDLERQAADHRPLGYLEIAITPPPARRTAAGGILVFSGLNPKTASREEIQDRAKLLQSEYPLVSVAGRLEYEQKKAVAAVPLSPTVELALSAREAFADRLASSDFGPGRRLESLRQLHSDQVETFVANPGFGNSRTPLPGPYDLPAPVLRPQPLASAEVDPPSAEPQLKLPAETAPTATIPSLPGLDRLTSLHGAGESEFFSLDRLGYVKDRNHVAGFEPHGFEDLPRLETSWKGSTHLSCLTEPAQHWVIRRLELVSLLKHDTPQVYLSKDLPRMEELEKSPTRPLNEFEDAALPRLVAEEDVVAQATLNRIEMVGAIRASRQCIQCHEVPRGQLLGAFSYTLVRDPLLIAPPPGDSAFQVRPATR